MKTCSKCRVAKHEAEFAKRAKARDGLQDRCRPCNNEYARENYRQNKDRYYESAKKRNREMVARVRALKSGPCTDCGQIFDPVCMDFDHLPEHHKVLNIASLLRHRVAWAKIEAEIAKCELVCSNCHRLRTKTRNTI